MISRPPAQRRPSDPVRDLMEIPGVGKSIARDLVNIGITSVAGLKGRDPEELYRRSNRLEGMVQDRCLLYVFRCAVYFANTPASARRADKLLWWNWKDRPAVSGGRRRA